MTNKELLKELKNCRSVVLTGSVITELVTIAVITSNICRSGRQTMRLIDADYLKNLPFERLIHTDFGDTAVPIEEIDNAPTVEEITNEDIKTAINEGFKNGYAMAKAKFERPIGAWIMNKTSARGRNYTCTNCQKVSRNKSEFCPKCGAEMRGGRE